MSDRIEQFLSGEEFETPILVVDLDAVEAAYRRLRAAFPEADVYYAVKANPGGPLLRRLVALGASFDCASIPEIRDVLAAGAAAGRVSYGNTIKKERHVAEAAASGVGLFALDSAEELAKIARSAPGADVFCRILTPGEGADWPLSRKFGCAPEMAADLLVLARGFGLRPRGVSFHVGSQQKDVTAWDRALAAAAGVFRSAAARGVELDLVNMGGGFPARYLRPAPGLEEYAEAIHGYLAARFGGSRPRIILEPGRSLVADAGALRSEVILVSRKSAEADGAERWVYLDVGKFGGLAETMDEAIKYRIATDAEGPTEPAILAGPTCDSADILYERFRYDLPRGLSAGDKLTFLSAGAYTASYAAVGFNGFAPLKTVYI
jgi:ornithine decarboxylase